MKTIQSLIKTIKDLISEATQNRGGYENMQLVPIPVRVQEKKLSSNNNH